MATNQGFTSLVPKDLRSSRFLYYWVQQNRSQLLSRSAGSTFLEISVSKVRDIEICAPSPKEQADIGEAVTAADDLIATLERLIAKKQAIKQGMMQQLLTGHTRLPGFGKPWRDLRLADLATLTKGTQLGRAAMKPGQSIPVWNGGIEPSGFTSRPNVDRPVVTVSEGGNSCGWVGRPQGAFWLGGHCYSLDPKPNGYSVAFLYHRLKFAEPQIMDLRVGSGLPNIQKKRLSDFVVSVPCEAEEAAAVSQVLDDVDHDLAVLGDRLTKAEQVRTGMMQQLLTGRTRLSMEAAS